MKTIPAALLAHYAQAVTTVCACLKITRADSVVIGFTEHDAPLVIDGVTYQPGFDLSNLQSSDTLSVDNMELRFLPEDGIPEADLLSGLYNNAQLEVFEVNYNDIDDSPSVVRNVLKRGSTGEITIKRADFYVVEFRSLTQALQQTQGIVTSKTCRARLGDSKCRKDITAFTYTGTLTSVDSARQFSDSARTAQAQGWFDEGVITFLTGDNAGFSQKVKVFVHVGSPGEGRFTLSLPFPYVPQVGDTYSVVAGCQKRRTEDCLGKFSNVLNFQGEPDGEGLDKATGSGVATAQPATTPEYPTDSFVYPGGGP